MKLTKFISICCFLSFIQCSFISEGEKIYKNSCMPCHMETGEGVQNLVPAFDENFFISKRPKTICAIIHGIKDSTGDRVMLAFPQLNDAQIANVLNYISKMKGYKSAFYNEQEVNNAKVTCK